VGVLCCVGRWVGGGKRLLVDLACIYLRGRVDISNTTVYGFCEKIALNFYILPNHSLGFKL
jgi:hypothetical protein